MNKIVYNLAVNRKVNRHAFAWRAAILVLAALLLGGIAVVNLARQHEKSRNEKIVADRTGLRLGEIKREHGRLEKEIAAWKVVWSPELAVANSLIVRKSFSFISSLDFLEKTFSPGIRVRHLALVNEPAGRISMAISTPSLKELFGLYKKLAPFDLVIANETQAGGEYQVNLNFKLDHEKI
jgi:hypothetical protein